MRQKIKNNDKNQKKKENNKEEYQKENNDEKNPVLTNRPPETVDNSFYYHLWAETVLTR